jgi:tRNA(Ile)-lysidine synthase
LGYELAAATYDHGLRGAQSAADADYVVSLVEAWGLPVYRGAGGVAEAAAEHRLNLEQAARQARYHFLLQTALECQASLIALGHQQDDQIETVLMHLIRGTGLGGLRGMLPYGYLSENHLTPDAEEDLLEALDEIQSIRPLLGLSRTELEAYAAEQGLQARHDPTNQDRALLRNKLRHELIPLLQTINPNFQATLGRMSSILQSDYEIIEQTVATTTARLVEWGETATADGSEGGEMAAVDKAEFARLSLGLQRQVIRRIVLDLAPDLGDLSFQQVEAVRDLIRRGGVGQTLSLPAEVRLSIGYDDFWLYYGGDLPYPPYLPALGPKQVIPFEPEGEVRLNDKLRLYSYWVLENHNQDLRHPDPLRATLCLPPEAELCLRTWRPGDRFAPLGLGGHHQKLSDVFSNLKIPKPLRDYVPLLLVNEEVAWFVAPTVNGVQARVSESFAVRPESEQVLRLCWEWRLAASS